MGGKESSFIYNLIRKSMMRTMRQINHTSTDFIVVNDNGVEVFPDAIDLTRIYNTVIQKLTDVVTPMYDSGDRRMALFLIENMFHADTCSIFNSKIVMYGSTENLTVNKIKIIRLLVSDDTTTHDAVEQFLNGGDRLYTLCDRDIRRVYTERYVDNYFKWLNWVRDAMVTLGQVSVTADDKSAIVEVINRMKIACFLDTPFTGFDVSRLINVKSLFTLSRTVTDKRLRLLRTLCCSKSFCDTWFTSHHYPFKFGDEYHKEGVNLRYNALMLLIHMSDKHVNEHFNKCESAQRSYDLYSRLCSQYKDNEEDLKQKIAKESMVYHGSVLDDLLEGVNPTPTAKHQTHGSVPESVFNGREEIDEDIIALNLEDAKEDRIHELSTWHEAHINTPIQYGDQVWSVSVEGEAMIRIRLNLKGHLDYYPYSIPDYNGNWVKGVRISKLRILHKRILLEQQRRESARLKVVEKIMKAKTISDVMSVSFTD